MSTIESLQDIININKNIKSASVHAIKSLHKLIFGTEGDRSNRKRIRDFTGFEFELDSAEFQQKIEHIVEQFTINELTSICNILNLNYEGNADEISKRILIHLTNLNLLSTVTSEEEDSSSEDEDNADDAVSSITPGSDIPQHEFS